mmetsp:Transcript_998/g.1594  ORF Transcript_998/g.1594 Transcript_998/m.1594 type:complete len:379 (+) Transcript_998:793-1929(+)|eukprot:CAMPEP_0203753030 /NCGR_PEP_ID=MMETSP0098-20131031/6862_1 /ASSEMBLY_ACC=CAM_ASM_000208 /TAXON_ID=96639 /ORGANISM=" , Strain NY0313808BC1" /LENGTH=378 /DNA_ID=CAMNT_0050643459 /DNA_START=770 /DNA_END=1906 /DNA_ORIENTATION=+
MKQVVVVGGGYCGSKVAREIDYKCPDVHVTLIDSRESILNKVSGLRAAVDHEWQNMAFIPRDSLMKRGTVVIGDVTAIEETRVVLADGKEIEFDYLVCATGARNRSVAEPPKGISSNVDIARYYGSVEKAVKESSSIVVVGAGVVGLELSGEIKEKYPEKDVTLVHSGTSFLNRSRVDYGKSFQRKLHKQLEYAGVKVVMGTRAEVDFAGEAILSGKRVVKLQNGDVISADLVFNCLGAEPNNAIYQKDWMNNQGLLRTLPTLQLLNSENIFAVGDINDVDEDKMLVNANHQVDIVANNVRLLVTQGGSLKKHSPSRTALISIPIGKPYGVTATPFYVFENWLTWFAKGIDLLSGRLFKDYGAYAPTPGTPVPGSSKL